MFEIIKLGTGVPVPSCLGMRPTQVFERLSISEADA